METARTRLSERLRTLRIAAAEFIYGASTYDMVQYALRLRADTENIFMLSVFGDLLGLPIMPPYYSMRLLPYVVPHIATWKRRVLREKDFVETEGLDLIG